MKTVSKVIRAINQVEAVLLGLMLCTMIVITTLQVIYRYVLNNPLIWSEELARFLFIWLVMFGAGYCVSRNKHIRVDTITNLLPQKAVRVIRAVIDILAIAVAVYLFPSAVAYAKAQMKITGVGTGISMGLIYGAVAVGIVLLVIHLSAHCILLFEREEIQA